MHWKQPFSTYMSGCVKGWRLQGVHPYRNSSDWWNSFEKDVAVVQALRHILDKLEAAVEF